MNSAENIEVHSSPFRWRRGCIILAGGLGTRLRSAVSDLPKCMAPVAGKPFLQYVIQYLLNQQVDSFIFSVGYKSEMIIDYVNENYPELNKQFSVEAEPLGTGGAIKSACQLATEKNVLIVNGDTLFKADVFLLSSLHRNAEADCTICLKPMQNFSRYGVVEITPDNIIAAFKEKKAYQKGLINGGVYVLHVDSFLQKDLPQKFSFEKDYLEVFCGEEGKIFGMIQDEYFIDIGIPEDYERAQVELGKGN